MGWLVRLWVGWSDYRLVGQIIGWLVRLWVGRSDYGLVGQQDYTEPE